MQNVPMRSIGPVFDAEWPPKVLQDLFHPGQVLPDPEFKPLDLQLLQREDDIQRQKTRESGADSQATDSQAGQS